MLPLSGTRGRYSGDAAKSGRAKQSCFPKRMETAPDDSSQGPAPGSDATGRWCIAYAIVAYPRRRVARPQDVSCRSSAATRVRRLSPAPARCSHARHPPGSHAAVSNRTSCTIQRSGELGDEAGKPLPEYVKQRGVRDRVPEVRADCARSWHARESANVHYRRGADGAASQVAVPSARRYRRPADARRNLVDRIRANVVQGNGTDDAVGTARRRRPLRRVSARTAARRALQPFR